MWSHQAIDAVGEEFVRIKSELRKIKNSPETDRAEAGSLLAGEITEIDRRVFDLLCRGEELPYFRQHYIEVSGKLLRFSSLLEEILSRLGHTPEILADTERYFEKLEGVIGSYTGAWLNLKDDITRSEREIRQAGGYLAELEETVADLIQTESSPETFRLAALFSRLIDCLSGLDLACKKLVVILKI